MGLPLTERLRGCATTTAVHPTDLVNNGRAVRRTPVSSLTLMKNTCLLAGLLAGVFTLAAQGGEPAAAPILAANTNVPPVSVENLSSRLDQVLAEKPTEKELQALAELGANLSAPAIPKALVLGSQFKCLRERVVFQQSIFKHWSELEPEAALAYIIKLPEGHIKAEAIRTAAMKLAQKNPETAAASLSQAPAGRSFNEAVVTVAGCWARTNAVKALAWIDGLPDNFNQEQARNAIRFIWVHSDPVAAAPHVEKMPPGGVKNALLENIGREWAAQDLQAALQWATHLTESFDRDIALSSVVEFWSDTEPAAAGDYALALAGELRQRAAKAVAGRWATQDPKAALVWAMKTASPEIERSAAEQAMRLWAAMSPADAEQWVETLADSPERDMILQSFVAAVNSWAPDCGANAALRIANEAAREQQLQVCLHQWREINPRAAKQWLQQAKLPDDLKARLRAESEG